MRALQDHGQTQAQQLASAIGTDLRVFQNLKIFQKNFNPYILD